MAVSNITVKGITPNLAILGDYQRFKYEDNVATFQLDSVFIPTSLIDSVLRSEYRNNNLSGFRWYHTTVFGDTIGTYTLQSFLNASPTGTDLMRVNQNNTIDFLVPTSLSGFSITANLDMAGFKIINLGTPTLATDGATKAYVDSVIGGTITLTGAVTGSGTSTIVTTLTPITTAQITNFNAAVTAYRLNQFAAPNTSIDLANNKIINLLTPTLASDATTKGYVDNKTWTTSVISDFNAAITAYRLNQFAAPNTFIDLGNNKIINLLTPTLNTDAATKGYVDSAISAGSPITLTGAVTGTGTGTIATILTNITTSQISNFNAAVIAYRLDQFAAPNTSVSMGSQKITNLLTPTLSTDAATKAYVDSFAGATLTLTGAVTGTGTGTIVTTLTNITTSQITNFNAAVTAYRLNQFTAPNAAVSMGSQRINNLFDPALAQDAATKNYVDAGDNGSLNSANYVTLKYQRSANVTIVNNIITNVLLAGIPQKISGSTNYTTAGFTVSGISNRVVYSGPETLFFTVSGAAQVSSSAGGSTNLNLEIVKNGVTGIIIPLLSTRVLGANTAQIIPINTSVFQLSTNDFIELFITASANTTVTVSNMSYTITTIAF